MILSNRRNFCWIYVDKSSECLVLYLSALKTGGRKRTLKGLQRRKKLAGRSGKWAAKPARKYKPNTVDKAGGRVVTYDSAPEKTQASAGAKRRLWALAEQNGYWQIRVYLLIYNSVPGEPGTWKRTLKITYSTIQDAMFVKRGPDKQAGKTACN